MSAEWAGRLTRRITPTVTVQLVLALAVVLAGLAAPYLVSRYLVGILTTALVLGLFAASINLMAGWVGLVSLGQAGVMASAAYAVAYVSVHEGSYLEQIAAGLGAGMLVAAVFGLMAMRTGGVYFLMITLAQGMIVWGMVFRMAPITGGDAGLVGIYRPEWLAPYWIYYYLVLAVVAVCFVAVWFIVRSPFGLTLQGLRDSQTRMVSLGYHPALYKFYVFCVAGFFATIAGILFVYNDEFVSPSVAEFMMSGHGVLMMILGGVGTLSGPFLGALIVVYVENVVSNHVDRWPTVMGLLFIAVVLFARRGVVGSIAAGWRRTAWGRQRGDDDTAATSDPDVDDEPAADPDDTDPPGDGDDDTSLTTPTSPSSAQ